METLKIILILIIGFLVLKPEYLEVIAKKIGFYWKKINIMKQSIQNLDEPTKENKQTTKTLAKEKNRYQERQHKKKPAKVSNQLSIMQRKIDIIKAGKY